MGWPVFVESTNDTCDDEMARSHPNGTGDEDALTTELVDPKDSGYGEDEFHNTDHTSGEQFGSVTSQTDALEDERTGKNISTPNCIYKSRLWTYA